MNDTIHTQPKAPQTEGTPKEDLYLKFSVLALLVLNVILLLYLTYKLYKFYRRTSNSNFEKRNKQYRAFIFMLILLALLLRGVFVLDQIYMESNAPFNTSVYVGMISDDLPVLIFISIACAFAYFWYEIYSSFENTFNYTDQSSGNLKTALIIFNVALYLAFSALAAVYITFKWQYTFLILHCIFIISLVASTVLLKVHGSNLYDKALTLVSYTGRNVKSSSGFRMIYILLLICCGIKCIKEGLSIFFTLTIGDNVLTALARDNNGDYLPLLIIYIALFYVFGEYGLFFCLILLLDFYADKATRSTSRKRNPRENTHALLPERIEIGKRIDDDDDETNKGDFTP
jgi:hypothetical protein